MVPGCLTMRFLLLLSISAPTGPCYDLQMGWWDTACYSVYFSSFNRCRCTHCWSGFPRSLQLLIILLKWLCICHNLHIKIICFAYTELFKLFVVNSWLNWVLFAVYKSSPASSQFYGDIESPELNILHVSVAWGAQALFLTVSWSWHPVSEMWWGTFHISLHIFSIYPGAIPGLQ